MLVRHRVSILVVAVIGLAILSSCGKKETKKEGAPAAAADTTLSYVSQEISFGVFFDPEGTKRTIELGPRDKQVTIHIVVHYPDTMQIAAVEYRLVLPPGVTIESDKFYPGRAALLGTFEHGISETFPCAAGPKIELHSLLLNVPSGLKDAEISLMPDEDNQFMGVAICDKGTNSMPTLTATSYKAIINPSN